MNVPRFAKLINVVGLKSLKIMNEPKSLTNEIDDRMIKKDLQRVKVTIYTKKMHCPLR